MGFHHRICGLLLWLLPLLVLAREPMDEIGTLVFQYPAEAKSQIALLEEEFRRTPATELNSLRLKLLKCELLLQQGDNEAAINLAQMGEATAKRQGVEYARPYFIACLADAYSRYNNVQVALPQLDTAVTLAKRYQQPQALIQALRLRGKLDTEAQNYTSAIEDLRVALDAYEGIQNQQQNWIWPPKPLIYGAMGQLMLATGDLDQARHYNQLGLEHIDSKGKVRLELLLNTAEIAIAAGKEGDGADYLAQARQLLPELSSPLELALGYSRTAAIELTRGRPDIAEDLLNIALNTFTQQQNQRYAMRAQGLLAQVEFAKNNPPEALRLMSQAIATAQQLQLYPEQAKYQLQLARFHESEGQFDKAFHSLDKSLQATIQAHRLMNQTRTQQLNTRLGQRSITAEVELNPLSSFPGQSNLSWVYSLMLVMISLLLALVLWQMMRQFSSRSRPAENNVPQSPIQWLEQAMQHAKRGGHSLSVLLLGVKTLDIQEIKTLTAAMKLRLRETDSLYLLNDNEILILLPYTSNQGADLVVQQLSPALAPWQDSKILLGQASMHQFDTSETLLKRATTRGMTRSALTTNPH
ncbi:tetratricopeptide repeat-containing diguanylate cyclase [Shewanella zhangzhouensis]|uniref:tetratricopeptide repeat-containing diguanylate cyclase n=1 Tax=Shewanella zhangzhouensis TaxID=2864213 RepID=UPI001C6554DF|nr:hypothetical protein [Shewanella zhangzhouensis]QYK05603.1 hypothetical protein K0H63_01750 [Shewanella zhangzhouensis]